jgi:hypothetical protein
MYAVEREAEVRTLTDPRVPAMISQLGLVLTDYATYGQAHAGRAES